MAVVSVLRHEPALLFRGGCHAGKRSFLREATRLIAIVFSGLYTSLSVSINQTATLSQDVLQSFGVNDVATPLTGGTQQVFRAGNIVFKPIGERSLENDHSPELAGWIAEVFASLPLDGFRIPKGVPTTTGSWITPTGWTAWTFVEGNHCTTSNIPQCISAIGKLHEALRDVPKNKLLDDSHTPWAKAQRWCLGDRPNSVQPVLKEYVDKLYSLRQPILASPAQLMHGDLNPENILVAEGKTPAFIDFSPFWGPPELALAIFANFIGPRQGDSAVLALFDHVSNFDQFLLRAGLRMLLVMSEINQLDAWASSSEKVAAELIIDYVETKR